MEKRQKMNNQPENIDKFFKERLSNLELKGESSGKLWRKLLFLLYFKRIIFWSLIIIAIFSGIFFFFTFQDSSRIEETFSDNTVSNHAHSQQEIPFRSENTEKSNISQEVSSNRVLKENGNSYDNNSKNKQQQYINRNAKVNEQMEIVSVPKNDKTELRTQNFKDFRHSSDKQKVREYIVGVMPVLAVNELITGNEFSIDFAANKNAANNYRPDDGEPGPEPMKNKWSAEIMLNPAYVTSKSSCECVSPDNNNYYKDEANNIFTVGASMGVMYSVKHFFLKSGADYSVYGENTSYVHTTGEIDEDKSYYTYDTVWGWVYDPPDVYPYPLSIDSTFNPFYKTESVNFSSRYNYLEIPLLIGYDLLDDRKVGLEISTGCSFGFLISAKGKMPSPYDDSFLDINKSSPFIRNSSINYILQLGIKFGLSEKSKFIIRPFYKRNLRSIFENDFPVKRKFNTFGVSFGITYKF